MGLFRRLLCRRQTITLLGLLLLLTFTCFQVLVLDQSHKWTIRNVYQQDAVDEHHHQHHQIMPSKYKHADDHTIIVYPDDGIAHGIRSNISMQRLRLLQQEIDQQSHEERCQRYGYFYNTTRHHRRRIFYGANIANEPWELFEMVAAEAYGIFEGMVFVESNRTQNFGPRPFRRLAHATILQELFGVGQVQVRSFVNEDQGLLDLDREHSQRNEIVKGWKEMGMTADDIGYISDPDETFSRDFLRAVQVCDGIVAFDYPAHQCGGKLVKLISKTRVFEMSPECIIRGYEWYHPDMILGACIEGIGNESIHPKAPRHGYGIDRAGTGIGGSFCGDWNEHANTSFPLWTPGDIRALCGGRQAALIAGAGYDKYTGYHFHNFFADFDATRFKYYSFAHPNPNAMGIPLEDINDETKVGIRCLKNTSDHARARHKRVVGGFDSLLPMLPLYFMDRNYRQQRHLYMIEKVLADEKAMAGRNITIVIKREEEDVSPPRRRRRKRKTNITR